MAPRPGLIRPGRWGFESTFMYHVYILENPKCNYYTGQTNNLSDRINRHNENRVPATKKKGPWKLVYCEIHNSRSEAVKREKYIKLQKDKKFIKRLIYDAGWRNGTSGVS